MSIIEIVPWAQFTQAIATIVALFIAIFFPIRAHRLAIAKEERERMEVAQSWAHRIMPDIIELGARFEAARDLFANNPAKIVGGRIMALNDFRIDVGPGLLACVEAGLIFRGDLGHSLHQLVSVTTQLNRIWVDANKGFAANDVPSTEQDAAVTRPVAFYFANLAKLIREVEEGVAEIHNTEISVERQRFAWLRCCGGTKEKKKEPYRSQIK